MSKIKSRDTSPEKTVRSVIHRLGYRFVLHKKNLPGKPDIVLPRHGKIIMVNGCFWHLHAKCRDGTVPKTNTAFWKEKLERNKRRDRDIQRKLRKLGWKILVVWECETNKIERLTHKLRVFLEE